MVQARFIPGRAALALIAAMATVTGPACATDPRVAALEEALALADVFAVMSEEGLAYGEEIATDMFPDAGGASWSAAVAKIYDEERLLPAFRARFEASLAEQDADVPAMLVFFGSDLGKRLTTLEISARRALLDESVEEASRLKFEELSAEGAPRVKLVEEFVAANDLVEANVTGAMNANYAFYQGLGDADALPGDMGDDAILAEIWSQEQAIRDETDLWIHSYLAMAYTPLTDAEMQSYIDFSRSEAGRELNRALFAGFDAVFVDVSRQLGQAAGRMISGSNL